MVHTEFVGEFNFSAHSAVSDLAVECDHMALPSTVSAVIHSLSSLREICDQGCTNPRHQVARYGGPTVRTLLIVALLAPRILKLVLYFWRGFVYPCLWLLFMISVVLNREF